MKRELTPQELRLAEPLRQPHKKNRGKKSVLVECRWLTGWGNREWHPFKRYHTAAEAKMAIAVLNRKEDTRMVGTRLAKWLEYRLASGASND